MKHNKRTPTLLNWRGKKGDLMSMKAVDTAAFGAAKELSEMAKAPPFGTHALAQFPSESVELDTTKWFKPRFGRFQTRTGIPVECLNRVFEELEVTH